MSITVRHPFKAKLDSRAEFIRHLLQEYPLLLEQWEKNTEKEMELYAEECAEGDEDIRMSILSQCLCAFDDVEFRKDTFYQAMLMMTYSYYESAIASLSKKANPREAIKAICNSKNITLSTESIKNIDYLQDSINPLRNNICHNNFGTLRNTETLSSLAEEWDSILYQDDTIILTDSAIIEDALNRMQRIFGELCEKLGYKSKTL